MKKHHVITLGTVLSILMIILLVQKSKMKNDSPANNSGEVSQADPTQNKPLDSEHAPVAGVENDSSHSVALNENGASTDSTKTDISKKENNCFRFVYQHQAKNQNRDIEDFLNDANAFPIPNLDVNQKNICVKVNDKPVNHKFVKKAGKAEVIIGSVVGPESTIQVSYCVGAVSCKETCVVKTKNKVDELLSDSEVGGLENAELETQVKELRNVASVHGELMDSNIIRDWDKIQSKEWVCEK